MFKRIELDNFRSFTHIVFDLEGAGGTPAPHALVYGENGSGKTDLVKSVAFLKRSIKTLVPEGVPEYEELSTGISAYAREAATVDATGPMSLRYTMLLNGEEVVYELRFSGGRVVYERLTLIIGYSSELCFRVDSHYGDLGMSFGADLFPDRKFWSRVVEQTRRRWGSHTFLALVYAECSGSDHDRLEEVLSPMMLSLITHIDGIVVSSADDDHGPGIWPFDIMSGTIPSDSEGMLDAYGEAIDAFFTRLCTDVGKVYYQKTDNGREISYRLMFSRRISGSFHEIPATMESAGTRRLLAMLPAFLERTKGSTVFIDGLDSGIHEKLVRDMMREILPSPGGQMVVTTHNTSLIGNMDPSRVFVIDVDALGNKDIRTMASVIRTQKGRNNIARYMDGTFGGVPYIGMLDLEDISYSLEEKLDGI